MEIEATSELQHAVARLYEVFPSRLAEILTMPAGSSLWFTLTPRLIAAIDALAYLPE
jgi:hypothetical protein